MSTLKPALFTFLRDLSKNNDRDWFNANKVRYEEAVKVPALAFISAFAPRLRKISKHFVADPRPVGGSLFRIYRDTRFSKDKTPYKTNTGLHFRHEAGKDAHAPGFYVHLEPGKCFVGVGLWRPPTPVAGQIRQAIADDPKGWKKAAHGKRFASTFELAGDSLKRPPSGFDKDHPLLEDLKRKDFIASANLPNKAVTAADFDKQLEKMFATGAPFMKFLCGAVGVPF